MSNKFRVWCNNKKEWEQDIVYLSQDGYLYVNMRNTGLKSLDEKNHVVEFYTGINDKNGKEIYVGDRVRVYGGECWYGTYEYDSTYVIKDLINDCFMIGNLEYIEIVGNIHEEVGNEPLQNAM